VGLWWRRRTEGGDVRACGGGGVRACGGGERRAAVACGRAGVEGQWFFFLFSFFFLSQFSNLKSQTYSFTALVHHITQLDLV
jgi:hypothetical protein